MAESKNIFRALHLDRNELPKWIAEFAGRRFSKCEVSEIEAVSQNGNQYRCKINGDGKLVLLDFYYNNDGTTTINPNVGQEKGVSVEIATYILSKMTFKESDMIGRSYSVSPINADEIGVINGYLQELEAVQLLSTSRSDTGKYTLYQYRSGIGDKLTLKYFDNQRLQIQGKPLYLYQEVTCLLSEYFPFDEVIKKQSEFFNIELDPEEVRDEMKQLLPTAYDVLGETMQKVLSAALALRKIDVPLEDYSSFVFPALKTLEGYIKSLFLAHGIVINKENGFGEHLVFRGKAFGHELKPDTKAKIGSASTIDAIERCYTFYNKHRHGLFHADAITDATRIIEKKVNADGIISEVLKLIEGTYNSMSTTMAK